ncbi:MAG: hypothetical protein H6673_09380 [Anaerolineales bacterium]|nr:hypothetical protein [Anaerolineales bacterium]
MNTKLLSLKVISAQIGEIQLESILQTLDRLHDAASEHELETVCNTDATTIKGWLEDIIFTAQEIISELHTDEMEVITETAPILKLYRQG